MKRLYRDRLKKLADHLDHGKLGHKKFDFNRYNYNDGLKGPTCGTSGCAIGECPILFPRHWKFDVTGFPTLKRGLNNTSPITGARQFFGITFNESQALFIPMMQNSVKGLPSLDLRATRKQVANNIMLFLKMKET